MKPSGLLLIDKPEGPTSHDVVAAVRRSIGQRRIGHTGTLDPLATGLLPLALGAATRLIRFLPHAPKHYTGTMRLGHTSDTDDIQGEIVPTTDAPLPALEVLTTLAEEYVGTILQRPPAYSARKVDGRRLYRLARAGVTVEAPAREVRVDRFRLSPGGTADRVAFEATVSAGTYVRSLVRDLGRSAGCGAVLESLRRTGIGPWSIDRALPWSPETDRETLLAAVVPVHDLPLELPRAGVADGDAGAFAAGRPIDGGPVGDEGASVAVRTSDGRLLGVGEWTAGRIQPRVALPPEVVERRGV